MKRAVSISLGSSARDKQVIVNFKGEDIIVERIGTDGNIDKARRLYHELDGKVDAFGVGGVDMYLRLDGREYPLRAVLKMLEGIHKTPLVAEPELGAIPRFRQAFVPVAIDRIGLAKAAAQVSEKIVLGDLMVALGVPIPVWGMPAFKRVARVMLPFVSHFPMSMIYYGSDGAEHEPKYTRYFEGSDLLAGDFLFMRKYLPLRLEGKTVITNTTTEADVALLQERGVGTVITTTPRYEGRSFGTNMMEAALTAYAGKSRPLTDDELNHLIDELNLRPSVQVLNP